MGVICSDPGHRPGPGLDNLRYTNEAEFDDFNDFDSFRQTPAIRRVPIPVNQLRAYRSEKKKRESFFDLDSVEDDFELMEETKTDVISLSTKSNQSTTLEKINNSTPDRKQEGHLPRVITVSCPNTKVSDTSSVCSDQQDCNSHQSTSVCSDRELNLKQEASESRKKEPVKVIVRSRGLCTDKGPVYMVRSKQSEYMRSRGSRWLETGPSDNVITLRGYCTDEITEKSDSESDSLKFVAIRSEARKSLCESMLKQSVSIDKESQKSVSGMTTILKSNRPKANSPHMSDTDSTSIRSGLSPVVSPYETYHRRNGSVEYHQPTETTIIQDRNSVDMIHDYQNDAELPMLMLGRTSNEIAELDGHNSQYTTVTGQTIKKNEGDEGLIFDTPGIVNTLIDDCQQTEYEGIDISKVLLP